MGADLLAAKQAYIEEQRQKNRESMPNLAALVDELKAQFPGAKLMWGVDLITGKEVGKRDNDPDKTFAIPEGYHPCRPVNLEKKHAGKNRSQTR